jgi:ribonuclease HI
MGVSRTVVYTDGACVGNPGPGGWAWAVVDGGPFASGPEAATTNQRMEIRAALEAAQALDGPLEIVSDSTYVVNCFRDEWWRGWVRNGWRNKAKQPVANQELWKPLIELYQAEPGRLVFRWVKGHSNDAMNDLVDRLAVDAARTQEGRSGVGVPEDLGAPDVVRGASGADPRVPAGWKVVVAGEGPAAKVAEVLAAKRELHPDLVVLTGEQWGVRVAEEAGVPSVLVLPFPKRELSEAAGAVVLQAAPPETKQKAAAAYSRRDAWLARHADEAVVVWDGDTPFVGKLVRSFQDHLGEDEVWVLHP